MSESRGEIISVRRGDFVGIRIPRAMLIRKTAITGGLRRSRNR